MSRNRGLLLAPLALLALCSAAQAARVQHAVTFDPASPNTFFDGQLTANGTLSLSFNGNINIQTPEILGTPISITAPLVIPNQTVNITSVPNPVVFSVDPNGTMSLDLEKSPETFFGAFPNTADSLRDAEIADMDLTLVGPGGLGVNTNQINVSGSATLDILGITDVTIPLNADLTAQAVLKNIIYSQSGFAFVPTNGTVTVPPLFAGEPDGSIQTNYSNIISAGSGSLQADANVMGDVEVDLGIFGTVTQDLGTIPLLENETIALDTLALIFDSMRLRDLEPGVYNGTPRNINVRMTGDLDILGGPVELEFNESFNQAVSIPFTFDVDLGLLGTVTLEGLLSGTLAANVDALFGLSGVSFGFEDQVVVDVLVPEPSSIALAGLGLVALAPVVWRRRRKSA